MNIKSWIRNIAALALLVCVTLTGCSLRSEKEEDMVPAEQVVEALCKLEMTDDASAITEILGFASEEEARAVLLDGVASDVELQLKQLLLTNIFLTEEDFEDIAEEDLMLFYESVKEVMKKMSCTVEKNSEQEEYVKVYLNVYGINFHCVNDYDSKYSEAAEVELTEGENFLRNHGDMLMKQKYYHHLLSIFLEKITDLDPETEPQTTTIICRKTVLEINGEEKTVWMPENRMGFVYDLAGLAVIQ